MRRARRSTVPLGGNRPSLISSIGATLARLRWYALTTPAATEGERPAIGIDELIEST